MYTCTFVCTNVGKWQKDSNKKSPNAYIGNTLTYHGYQSD